MPSAKATTNHDTIRRWVEARGGHPASVKRTARKGNPGVLRIDYPGFSGEESLKRIDWDTWFDWFDRDHLAFLYQNTPRSRFSKLIERDSAPVETPRKRTTTKRATAAKRPTIAKSSTTAKRSTAAKSSTTAKRLTAAKRSTSTKRTASAKKAASSGNGGSRRTPQSAKTTTNHNVIKRWVESHGGYPARVKRSGRGKDPGILRIDYPGFSGEQTLERIEWDEFFDWFDRDNLAFLYRDSPRSRFSKLIRR